MQFYNISFLAYNKVSDNSQQGSFFFSSIKSIGLSMSTLHAFAFLEIMAPVLLIDGIYDALIIMKYL